MALCAWDRRWSPCADAHHHRDDVHAPLVTPADDFLKRARGGRELAGEAETLRAFGVQRAVAVREVRVDTCELVVERVTPGETLASIATEDKALKVVAQLFA